ncbi:ATP-binding protein [Amycolatopsis eburnea]|uniref:ATP-binding protein n=1 Tax=Amycolatopsis eburnea TaxID=2267691 RepID=A0A427TQ40_9PSEU|nr:ATP-binding protein [Amycolatopsis eburnea]RSD26432.1 ATP-binding protein [Amycolatopsis eburnea]
MTSAHDETPLLRVLVGPPGSGKTTLCQAQLTAGRWGVRVSLDDARARFGVDAHDQSATTRALAWAFHHVDQLLARGFEVTIDATSTTARERSNWLAIAAAHQTPVVAVIVRTPPAVAHERNAARERPVPADVVDGMAARVAALTVADLLGEGFAHVTEHTTAAPEEASS